MPYPPYSHKEVIDRLTEKLEEKRAEINKLIQKLIIQDELS